MKIFYIVLTFFYLHVNMAVEYKIMPPSHGNGTNLHFYSANNSSPVISYIILDGAMIIYNNSNNLNKPILLFTINEHYGLTYIFYDGDDNKGEFIVNGYSDNYIFTTIWTFLPNKIMNMYKYDLNGFFLTAHDNQLQNKRTFFASLENSSIVFKPQEIDSQPLDNYTKLLFSANIPHNITNTAIGLFGLHNEYELYKKSDNFFIIKKKNEETKEIVYYFDFSDPAYVCKIECYRDDDLVMQIVYHGDYNLSVICFSKIANKDLIVRSNRTGAEDITIEYIVVDGDKAYLYNPKINLAEASLEAQEVETDTLKNKN